MPVSFSDLQLAFEFVSDGGKGENEAYLDRQSGNGVDPVRWTVCHLGRLGFLEHQRLVSDWG